MPGKKKIKIEWDRSADDASDAALELFVAIADEHGLDVARKIFAATMLLNDLFWKQARHWEILDRYDRMQPKPNVMKLARELHAEGLGSVATVDHRIRELLRKRKKAIADGTWLPAAPRPIDAVNADGQET